MALIVSRWRSFAGGIAIAAGLLPGALGLIALAQSSIEGELIGAGVYAASGIEVGEVAAVTLGEDGQITEVRVATSYPLGLGQRVVVVRRGAFLALRGAIVLDMSPEEFRALPSAATPQGTLARAKHNDGGMGAMGAQQV